MDDTTLNIGVGGDVVRSIEKSSKKTQVVVLDLGGSGAESLLTTALPVTGAFFQAEQPISAAALPLPAGAATGAKQDTGNTSIGSIDTKTPALGQQLAAASSPVVLTAAQLSTLTPPAAIAGFALEAGHLAAIDTATARIPAQGQALAAASTPVVMTAAQISTLTPLAAVQANAGTNLNTSALALESSLSSLNGKVTAVNTGAVVIASGAVTATDGGSGKTLKSAVISLTATGTVIAAVGGKRLKVYAIKLICSAALSVNWRDGASTALEGVQSIAINAGYTESVQPPSFLFGTASGNTLDLVITGIGTAAGRVSYWDDDAA